VDFFAGIKQPINQDNKNIVAWYDRMKALPSAAA
jgi:glutathione S-transferase